MREYVYCTMKLPRGNYAAIVDRVEHVEDRTLRCRASYAVFASRDKAYRYARDMHRVLSRNTAYVN
jgi:hypothetical protein